MQEFEIRRDPTTMTADERADELSTWFPIIEIPFELQHKRIDELMGRSVYTHEMIDPDALIAECRNGQVIGMEDVLAKAGGLWGDKVFVVVPS